MNGRISEDIVHVIIRIDEFSFESILFRILFVQKNNADSRLQTVDASFSFNVVFPDFSLGHKFHFQKYWDSILQAACGDIIYVTKAFKNGRR